MEKYCSYCGAILTPGAKFCSGCGRSLNQQAAPRNQVPQNAGGYQSYGANQGGYTPAANQNYYQPPMMQKPTKKEYRKICTNEKYRKDLKSSAIALYVLTVLNALIAIAANPGALLDTAIFLALTLGMHLGKSKGCAIGLLCFAIFSVVIMLISTGSLGGWLWVIAAIGGLRAFSAADKEYEAAYGA